MGIDGTESRPWFDRTVFYNRMPNGYLRPQSHIRNFVDDYYGVAKQFFHGPDARFPSPAALEQRENEVVAFIEAQLIANPNRRVDLVGHSRGGMIAIEVARRLVNNGFNGKKVNVRFLGLYDPVDMVAGYGDFWETIPAVESVAVIYAAGSSEEIGIEARLDLNQDRSRPQFNRVDGAAPPETEYNRKWIFGTHSGIGGAPWLGDMPLGHTESNDRAKAIESDQYVRLKARASQVPINGVSDYGYQYPHPGELP